MKTTPFVVTSLAALLAFSSVGLTQPSGPPKGDGEGPEADENMGDTSILMGSVVIPDSAAACDATGYARIVCLADLLKSGASDEILADLKLDYSVEEAQNWSNLPAGAFPARPGVFLGQFSEE